MALFLCLSGISMELCSRKRKSISKGGGSSEKKIKRGDGHIGGLYIEWGFKPSAHYERI